MTSPIRRYYSGHYKAARKRAIRVYRKKGSGARHVDSGLQVQLEKDRSGSTRQIDGVEWSVVNAPLV